MTKSGRLRSYWSFASNVHNKISGTQKEKIASRKAVKKLTGIKLNVFPTISQTRSLLKKWSGIKKEKAKQYQSEVKRIATKEKNIKLKNLSTTRKITLRGVKGDRRKKLIADFKDKRIEIIKEGKRRGKINLKDAELMMPSFNIDGTPSEDFPSGES